MTLHHRESTVSTNLDARAGRPGDVYAADYQTAGRGRLDHVWEAPRGQNALFSAVLDVADLSPAAVATLPLVVGLAVAETVEPLLRGGATVALKWPNDVLAGGRKLCGILCERNGDCVIAGVGLNVNQTKFPPALATRATSLALLTGHAMSVSEILLETVRALYDLHGVWRREGFAAVRARWAARDCLKGRMVSVRQTDADPEPISGRCGGVQDDGTLLVGETPVYAGEAHVLSIGTGTRRR